MAIEALSQDEGWFEPEAAIKACKEALEQPAQEPIHNCPNCNSLFTKEIYSIPAPSWQGLSDDEIRMLEDIHKVQGTVCEVGVKTFAHAIEQALKEKNHVI